jgi:hypothetical protein
MIATRVTTVLLAGLLLLPFVITFVQMIVRTKPDDATVAEFERLSREMRSELDELGGNGSMARAIVFYDAISIHPRLHYVWSVSPRRWAGVVGLTLVACLLALLAFSVCFPKPTLSQGYATSDPGTEGTESDIPFKNQSFIIRWDNTSSSDK